MPCLRAGEMLVGRWMLPGGSCRGAAVSSSLQGVDGTVGQAWAALPQSPSLCPPFPGKRLPSKGAGHVLEASMGQMMPRPLDIALLSPVR